MCSLMINVFSDVEGADQVGKWREGMTATLNLDIPWASLQDELARPDQHHRVQPAGFRV